MSDSILSIEHLSVPTILQDNCSNIIAYINTLDKDNILRKIINENKLDKESDDELTTHGQLGIEFVKEENIFVVIFGFVYEYQSVGEKYCNGKINKISEKEAIAAIINSKVKVLDNDSEVKVSQEVLALPLLSKASQLTYNLTSELASIPQGTKFDVENFEGLKNNL
ncbi:hypothetical protein [Lactobacillus sp. ESL0703]|uniref:hypothetical protein n=1 Tax=Lactobacillus sp. ESL0703 TaxID=2983218 RepID=UPI0023F8D814|nr:hypothetical protein [Lactobacillus sp. ESL0703]MDF7668535.1 hypothetical protein [Lactobacillus sp. ESL0703]